MKNKKAKAFSTAFRKALTGYEQELNKQVQETPYGIPYRPHIWGAGWDIQRFGFQHYFLTTAYPEIFPKAPVFNALNFILGCHPEPTKLPSPRVSAHNQPLWATD
ncbi:hypothetical protein NXV51_08320 [Bacteroides uniformis]|nr:hypothetical protein [Bacteroides uniformis]